MADVFKKEDALSLINGKHILFIGDSNIRALYKDLLWLSKINSLIGVNFLKRRLEGSYLGDKLVGRSELTRGRDFTEHRIFESNGIIIEFLFITRCYCDSLIKVIEDIKRGTKHCPDVILMNSCLWDVSRWGPNGVNEYKVNMEKLMKLLSSSLPKHALFIWATALPIAALTSGGLLIKQIEFLQAILRIHVIEANAFSAAIVSSYGYDVLDFHYYMRYQIIRRSADGIHFLPTAMRFLTNLFLTHIAVSWDVKLPGNLKTFTSCLAMKTKEAIEASASNEVKQMFKKMEVLAETLNKTDAGTPKSRKRKKKKQANQVHNLKKTYKEKCDMVQTKSALIKTPPNYHKASLVCHRRMPNYKNSNTLQSYNNLQSWINFQSADNVPSSSHCQNNNYFQINRLQNVNDFDNIHFPMKDFRLLGFDDFSQSCSSSNMDDRQLAYRQQIPVSNNHYGLYDRDYEGNVYCNPPEIHQEQFQISKFKTVMKNYPQANPIGNSIYNNNYDRFSCYHNHPYKSSQSGWEAWRNRETWHNDEAWHNNEAWHNGESYQCYLGPVRQRWSRYNSGRHWH